MTPQHVQQPHNPATPETEEVWESLDGQWDTRCHRMRLLARKLERERNKARAEIAEYLRRIGAKEAERR